MTEASQSARCPPSSLLIRPGSSLLTSPPNALVTPRRLDLVVKYLFFLSLHGGNDVNAEKLYVWHIKHRSGSRMEAGLSTDKWKRDLSDYVSSATFLYRSMVETGFDPAFPVPIDADGELLDGSHRLACALALRLEEVPVWQQPRKVWAPAWDCEWFLLNGMEPPEVNKLMEIWKALYDGDY